ncbi:hypothetical protein [Pseudorhodoferax sp. Leaf267]|uniref:hypothetical protein n=1 Tax=Pseudorhodoferax sp. Leaf267 TaxID=1736316 RepID=UPI000701C766|nr:hypothetical protein [Pseudorhodoferax sp. Leaf267]KQP12183.1 hypothetical protein ASF43_21955 [Pseudorhodoferax sp. Leaf267]
MKDKEYFWNVDLRIVLRQWWQDVSAFVLALVLFLAMSLPVVIPTLILWYLFSIDFKVAPPAP